MRLIRYILILIMQGAGVMAKAHDIVTAKNLLEAEKYLKNIPANSTIFFDIDDTVITPASKAFRNFPYKNPVDEIKHNKKAYANFDILLSNWRLERKVQLVDSKIPALITALRTKYPVYGLTKMDSGKFGNIESMEKWRANELQSLGIEFFDNLLLPGNDGTPDGSTFYKGIFITGKNSKSQLLEFYKNMLNTQYIVLIDDKKEQLLDIKQFCDKNKIGFLGILFTAVANSPEKPDPEVVKFQKEYLIEQTHWLEDEEAEKLMKKEQ